MNKFFKSIAAVALIMLTAACSSESDFEAQVADVEGIPFEITVNGGESSRLTYTPSEMTETKTPYKWTIGDRIYVIDDAGKYVGTITCKSTDGQSGTFTADKLPLQDGERLHFWFFGQAQNFYGKGGVTPPSWDSQIPEQNAITPSSIVGGKVTASIENQYHYENIKSPISPTIPTAVSPKASKFNEVLAQHGIVKVEDGKATLNNGSEIVMKHLTSVASVKLSNEWHISARIKGCNNKAIFNLVGESIESVSDGDITMYQNFDSSSLNPTTMDIILLPGKQSPVIEYEVDGIAFTGKMSTIDVKSGIHYIDWTNTESAARYIKVNTQVDTEKSAPIVFNKFQIDDEGNKVYFGRSNLYAIGDTYPATVGMMENQNRMMPYFYSYTGNLKETCWGFLDHTDDSGNGYPRAVYSDYSGEHWKTVSGTISNTDAYNPVRIFNQQESNRSGRDCDFRLPAPAEFSYMIENYYWARVKLDGYYGNDIAPVSDAYRPSGFLFTPVRIDTPKEEAKELLAAWAEQLGGSAKTYVNYLIQAIDEGWSKEKTYGFSRFSYGTWMASWVEINNMIIEGQNPSIFNPIYNSEGKLIGQPLFLPLKYFNGGPGAELVTYYMTNTVTNPYEKDTYGDGYHSNVVMLRVSADQQHFNEIVVAPTEVSYAGRMQIRPVMNVK